MKQKKKYTVFMAYCIFDHPFEDRKHLRKRKMRYEEGHCDDLLWEIWSEDFHAWLPFPRQEVFEICFD